jgi:hypothetical protein
LRAAVTLLDLLAKDLLAWMDAAPDGVPRAVLLWLDPEKQFQRLAVGFDATLTLHDAQLLSCSPEQSQLRLKLALLHLEAQPSVRAVVYLPGFGPEALEPQPDGRVPELWGVYEYRYKACIWGRGSRWEPGMVPELPTLAGWLRGHGVKLADEKTRRALSRGGADALLSRYTERQRTTNPADWPQPLRMSDVEVALAGDPRDALRRLLAAPGNEVKRWGQERSTTLGRIDAEFGLAPPADDVEPEQLANEFAVALALTEAWDAFGRPEDFPYLSRLPTRPDHRDRLVTFLREDILGHGDLGPRFRQRMRRLESSYPLASWARDRQGQPGGLPVLALTRWQQFLERFTAASSRGWRDAREVVRAERDVICAGASAPWTHLDPEVHWDVANELTELALGSEAATRSLETHRSVDDLVTAYAGDWWQLDRLHLRVRAGAALYEMPEARRVVDGAYFDYVSRVGDHFSQLVETGGVWPPGGAADVTCLRRSLWDPHAGRHGVIVSDGLRLDLAHDLAELLDDNGPTLDHVLSTLPSNTPFGMSALLPLTETPVGVDFSGGKAKLTQDGAARLEERDGRKDLLARKLLNEKGKPAVGFVDLEQLLKDGHVPGAQVVVVFDQRIDEQGHKGTEELPGLVGKMVRNLKRAIDMLHNAGIGTVHVVTDHGFLLLPPDAVDGLGAPQVPPTQYLYKHQRWTALRPGALISEVLRLPLPLSPEITLGFARGVRSLEKAEQYLHGGISLQECVIPHLVSHRALPQARLGVELLVTTDKLAGGTVPVVVRPRTAAGQAPLGGYQPVTVRLWVETTDTPPRIAAGPMDLLIRDDVQELKPPLYLAEGLGLEANHTLRLRAMDADTGQDLGSKPLTLMVDWE